MAASFFQGVLGQFAAYNAFGGTHGSAQGAGHPGYARDWNQAPAGAQPDAGQTPSLPIRASVQAPVAQDVVKPYTETERRPER
jgi:hypothetical protein